MALDVDMQPVVWSVHLCADPWRCHSRRTENRALCLRAAVMGGTSEQGRSSQRPLSGARLRAGMRGKLPDVVKLPPSVTVPFSSFEEALKQNENKAMAKRLEAAVTAIPETNAEEKLRECRDIVMEARRRPCPIFWIHYYAEKCCSVDSVLE